MDESSELFLADRILDHLEHVAKTFKVEKKQDARELLLREAFEGGGEEVMKAVHTFKEVREVLSVYNICSQQKHVTQTGSKCR